MRAIREMAGSHLHLLGEIACALGLAVMVGVTADPEPPLFASALVPPDDGKPTAAAPAGQAPELVAALGSLTVLECQPLVRGQPRAAAAVVTMDARVDVDIPAA